MTTDIWAKIRGVWVFIKFGDLSYLIFPNGNCKQDVILKGRIRSDTRQRFLRAQSCSPNFPLKLYKQI